MTRRPSQRGALLVEVMISVLVCAFAVLGLTAMQARATGAEFESLQRSQALVLVEDMVARVSTNRANAGDYVSASLLGDGNVVDCAGMTGAALDLCEWGNLLRGSTETRAGARVGAMQSARGCVVRSSNTTHRFVISVVWQGVVPTGAPPAPCGSGHALYSDDTLRRVASATVCVAQLRDAATAPAVPRC